MVFFDFDQPEILKESSPLKGDLSLHIRTFQSELFDVTSASIHVCAMAWKVLVSFAGCESGVLLRKNVK